MPSLPTWLSVEGLKTRIDKQLSGDDSLLSEYLLAALVQAQAPAPAGCGRLLVPDPPLNSGGADDADPVTRVFDTASRNILLPDARAITQVTLDGETLEVGHDYRTTVYDGVIVRLRLAQHHHRYWRHRYHHRPHYRTVEVTGRFGFIKPPEDLIEGIYILAGRAFYEREAQYADQVPIAEGAPVQTYFRQLPPRTKLAFATYTLPSGLAGLA